MKRIVIVQKVIEKSEGPLTPTITKLFRFTKEAAVNYNMDWNGAEFFRSRVHGVSKLWLT